MTFLNLKIFRNEVFILSVRYFISFIFIMIVYQKVTDPVHQENLTDLFLFIFNADFYPNEHLTNKIFHSTIFIQILIVIALYNRQLFNSAIYASIILLCLEITANIYSAIHGIKSPSNYGLFGENPYILLTQQMILLLLVIVSGIYKSFYFKPPAI